MEDQDAFSKVAGKWSDHEYILNGKLTGYADRPNEKCGWKARVASSVAGHKQKSCPLRSCAFAQTEIYTLSMLMNVISFDPHSDRT